jgi:hypothetical protein
MVAQVDEQNAAMVAHAVHPAREPDIGAGVALAKRGAGVGTVAMHVISSRLGRRADNGGSAGEKTRSITVSARGRNRAEKRMTHPVCQAERAQSGRSDGISGRRPGQFHVRIRYKAILSPGPLCIRFARFSRF